MLPWRRCTALAAWGACQVALGQALSPEVNASNFLELLPECAVTCYSAVLESANCALDNELLLADCMCTNGALRTSLLACSQASCAPGDGIPALLVVDGICQPYPKESRGTEANIAAALTFVIAIPVLVARCAARLKFSRRLWSDDYMSIAATVFLLVLAITQIISVEKGFGMHQWESEIVENSTFLLLILFVSQILYILVQCIAKLAVLLLYQRIFSLGAARWFRLTVKGFIGLSFVMAILFTFLILFQCWPVQAAWDLTIPDAKCLNFAPLLFAGSLAGILTDIILILLPITELRKLQISGKKRIGVSIMFAIALLGVVASVVRLQYLVRLNWSYDLFWDEIDVVIWSLIELLCIVVCGSLPALRPFIGVLLPKVTATLQRSSWSLKRSTFSGGRSNAGKPTEEDAKELAPRSPSSPLSLYPLHSVGSDGEWTQWSKLPAGNTSPTWPRPARLPKSP
ncbi:hypothetical protein JX266_000501 [Neoarthrinium moseri]|nr:hypothetical protein JX266_000501 [Neoarthrinium moseri]